VEDGFEDDQVVGRLEPTGVQSKLMPRLKDAGIDSPPSGFGLQERPVQAAGS